MTSKHFPPVQVDADGSPSSPCIRNCCLNEADICIGCGRSIEEITRWGTADAASKRDILARAERRRAQRKNSFFN